MVCHWVFNIVYFLTLATRKTEINLENLELRRLEGKRFTQNYGKKYLPSSDVS